MLIFVVVKNGYVVDTGEAGDVAEHQVPTTAPQIDNGQSTSDKDDEGQTCENDDSKIISPLTSEKESFSFSADGTGTTVTDIPENTSVTEDRNHPETEPPLPTAADSTHNSKIKNESVTTAESNVQQALQSTDKHQVPATTATPAYSTPHSEDDNGEEEK
jgi:hypothetical protein